MQKKNTETRLIGKKYKFPVHNTPRRRASLGELDKLRGEEKK